MGERIIRIIAVECFAIHYHMPMWLPSRKIEKGLSIIAGCTVYSSCLVCKLLCNHGFRVISSLIDAFARSSTSGNLCCRVTCLCICISADTAGQRGWILTFHEHASVGATRLKPTFSFLLWSSVFNLLFFFFLFKRKQLQPLFSFQYQVIR